VADTLLASPYDDFKNSVAGDIGQTLTNAFDKAMAELWAFGKTWMTLDFGFVDALTEPNLKPTGPHAPLAGILPLTMWLGLLVFVMLFFVQIGRAVGNAMLRRHGEGFSRIGLGLVQYVLISAAGMTVLNLAVKAADRLADGILQVGMGVKDWSHVLSGCNSLWMYDVHAVSAVGLGIIAILCVIPASLAFLLEEIVREAAILILAAVVPIAAAGLISESTKTWFWKTLRWLMALVMLPPTVALVMAVGFKLFQSSIGVDDPKKCAAAAPLISLHSVFAGKQDEQQTLMVVLGALILVVAVMCPLTMFKLFAFVDPGTPSGQSVRGMLSGFGSGSKPSGGGGGSGSGTSGGDENTQARFSADPLGMQQRGQALAQVGSATLDEHGVGDSQSSPPAGDGDSGDSGDGSGHQPPQQPGGQGAPPPSQAVAPPQPPNPPGSPSPAPPSGSSPSGSSPPGGAAGGQAGGEAAGGASGAAVAAV
jgi:hypothetical protein